MDVVISEVSLTVVLERSNSYILCSLGAPLCVLYKPNTIAAAALLLATNLSSNDRLNENWYENLHDIDVVQVHGKLNTS
jgi:hypothetical protein